MVEDVVGHDNANTIEEPRGNRCRVPGNNYSTREPPVRFELTTARLRIESSTPELRWRIQNNALERTRTAMPFGTTPSRWRVYQFHHQGKPIRRCITAPYDYGADGARTRDLSSDSRVL